MKMKSITAIVAFSIAFGFSALVAGLFAEPNVTGEEISALLLQDVSNGQEVDEVYQSTTSSSEYAHAVDNYAVKMDLLDDTDLPADFRAAWQAHKQAWRKYADFLACSSLLKKRMSEEQLSRIDTGLNYQIAITWLNVLKFGKKYGADIPLDAY